jgi:hypothetical protein
MKYRKKPVVIDAIQWDGTYTGMIKIEREFKADITASSTFHPIKNTVDMWNIKTLEGSLSAEKGDYIIKGVKGEFYPCKPDIFRMTYEIV